MYIFINNPKYNLALYTHAHYYYRPLLLEYNYLRVITLFD